MEINIGNKLRELRKEKKISIAVLSKESGVSTGLISQIERGIVVPSVVNLWKISQALDINVGYFFEEGSEENKIVVRKEERKKIVINRSKGIYELLTPDLKGKIEFLQITLKKGEYSSNELITHEGEECGIVIKGTMTVKINNKDYVLNEGDSIYFNSTIPHKYLNEGEEECISIWAMTPPSF